ncbi:MAG: L-seryl-tRNA(Sec) selenium transferase [Myxococcota bacterium]|jgi:L-seryl-tRNA(Ser) seleniumtransferase|nr:L-seryl-tRNA(Sec) selenium transferase [Myxococcota bacterium]
MNSEQLGSALQQLPKIDSLLESEPARRATAELGREFALALCRKCVDEERRAVLTSEETPSLERILGRLELLLSSALSRRLLPVINATGVLLHTNLGRAPLGAELLAQVSRLTEGYLNLEMDVRTRQRGVRAPRVIELVCELTGGADAVVVNNNAAAVMLVLATFAKGREVIVSRGELIQIGGGFRIPEVLEGSGAKLVEVGTTNITTAQDYAAAITDNTAALLKVHRANFRMEGFVESPSIEALSQLDRRGAVLLEDLGSGNLLGSFGELEVREPGPARSLAQGADLVCFSCDKMLGLVQAGVIVGKAELVRRIAQHPLLRALRLDKLRLAALEVGLSWIARGELEKIPLYRLATVPVTILEERALHLVKLVDAGSVLEIVPSIATFGGGTTPGQGIPSVAVAVRPASCSAQELAQRLQNGKVPVLATTKDQALMLDLRTVHEAELDDLARLLCAALCKTDQAF